MKESKCKDCLAVQEAEQNPDAQCDPCGWADDPFCKGALMQLVELEEAILKGQE